MVRTAAELAAWLGREALDPFERPLGTVVAIVHALPGGEPAWLLIAPPSAAESALDGRVGGRLAPLAGAEESGRRIRVAALAPRVAAAPPAVVGEPPDEATLRAAERHYGGPTAAAPRAERPAAAAPPGERPTAAAPPGERPAAARPPLASAPAGARRGELIAALKRAHALEQAGLRRLAAIRWRARDEELVHDVTLHHEESNRHAALLRERLAQLGEGSSPLLDAAARAAALARAEAGRLRRPPEPRDALALIAFERREIAAYEALERLARDGGDAATAALAREIRADEVAMAARLSANWVRWGSSGYRTTG